jgi:hypothetical protein
MTFNWRLIINAKKVDHNSRTIMYAKLTHTSCFAAVHASQSNINRREGSINYLGAMSHFMDLKFLMSSMSRTLGLSCWPCKVFNIRTHALLIVINMRG